MNSDQSYSDPRGGLVCKLTSGVEELVDVTGTVGEVRIRRIMPRIEPESGPSASAFLLPLEPGASALPSSRVTVTAETPSNDIRVPQNINRDKHNITTNIPFRMKTADNKIAICTGIPFFKLQIGRRLASQKNCVWKGRI